MDCFCGHPKESHVFSVVEGLIYICQKCKRKEVPLRFHRYSELAPLPPDRYGYTEAEWMRRATPEGQHSEGRL